MESLLVELSTLAGAAGAVTKLIDATRNKFDPKKLAPAWVWNIESFLLGIGAAYLGHLSLFSQSKIDVVLTGMVVGFAASGWHEVLDFFSSKAKEAKAETLSIAGSVRL